MSANVRGLCCGDLRTMDDGGRARRRCGIFSIAPAPLTVAIGSAKRKEEVSSVVLHRVSVHAAWQVAAAERLTTSWEPRRISVVQCIGLRMTHIPFALRLRKQKCRNERGDEVPRRTRITEYKWQAVRSDVQCCRAQPF